MVGDDRVRFCGLCRKNVYDLSTMTSEEARAFVQGREGTAPPCVRFYMRSDGTALTADCPEGRRRVLRRRFGIAALASAALALAAAAFPVVARWTGGSTVIQGAPCPPPLMGDAVVVVEEPPSK
jgi:hypothetical protein